MTHLPFPSRFFPLAHGKYEVSAGLKPLGTDYGNGAADHKTFLIDLNYPRYREAKLRSRAERLEKYYPPSADLEPEAQQGIARFIAETLARDYPESFSLTQSPTGHVFNSLLTGETFSFSADFALVSQETSSEPPYRDEIDALTSLLQEDISIWKRSEDQSREWLASLHLCFPNHWGAEDKIGKPFNAVHAPVAGFQKLAKAAPGLVEMMVSKGPFVRFAWGVATDIELNHHPKNEFQGRQFDPLDPKLYLRIERQTLTSFPHWNASLFTIRTYFLDCASEISALERKALTAAIQSMNPESLRYKGLTETHGNILSWISTLQFDP